MEEMATDAPVDGISRPAAPPPPTALVDLRRKRILALLVGGVVVLAYVAVGIVLMMLVPASDGGKQILRTVGVFGYGAGAGILVLGGGVVAYRLFKSRLPDSLKLHFLLRLVALVVALVSFSGLTIFLISRETPLSIDVLEPSLTRGLVAPVAVTYGTETLRSILSKSGLFPVRYRWDFDGNGSIDADRQEPQVTTIYKRKGLYSVRLDVVLSDGTVRQASRRLEIPHGVFSLLPPQPTSERPVLFTVANLYEMKGRDGQEIKIDEVTWDFNGDDIVEVTSREDIVTWSFAHPGTYLVRAVLRLSNGVQESYERQVVVLEAPPPGFRVDVETEGMTKGSPPLGVIFRVKVEEGVAVSEITWQFAPSGKNVGSIIEYATGDRVSYTFMKPGPYEVVVTVVAKNGDIAQQKIPIEVLTPLMIPDLKVKTSPEAKEKRFRGSAPFEVTLEPLTAFPLLVFMWEQEGASRVFKGKESLRAVYELPGTYPIVLVIRDVEGRELRIPYEVTVLPPPARVELELVPPTGIAPLVVTFDASQSTIPGKQITGFSWLFGDKGRGEEPQYLGSQVTHRYEEPGNYTVTVRAHTEDGEVFEAKKSVIVRASVLDACIFPSRNTGRVPFGVKFYSDCSAGRVATYLWDFGDGSQSEEPSPSHVFQRPGAYTVTLTIRDGQNGEDTTSTAITAEPPHPP